MALSVFSQSSSEFQQERVPVGANQSLVLASALVMLPPPLLCLMFAACSLGLGNCLKLLSIPTPPGALFAVLLQYSPKAKTNVDAKQIWANF